jgi:hypothetical protein
MTAARRWMLSPSNRASGCQVCAKTATAFIPSLGGRFARQGKYQIPTPRFSLLRNSKRVRFAEPCRPHALPFREARDFFFYMTDLFTQLVDFENLHAAYRGARDCKRYRSSILKFGYQLEENLLTLQWELAHKTYKHGGYREFVVTDSKKRVIRAAPFRDRVVHHAVCNAIEPLFERGFIYDSYACRRGKGTHAAVVRLEYFIKALTSCPPAIPSWASTRERERERERESPRG